MNGFCHLSMVKTLLSERYIDYILIRVIGWTVFFWTLNLAQMKHVLSAICLINISLRAVTPLLSLYTSYVITNIAAPHPVETSRFHYCMGRQSNNAYGLHLVLLGAVVHFHQVSITAVNSQL